MTGICDASDRASETFYFLLYICMLRAEYSFFD